jgi:hypothetical protein
MTIFAAYGIPIRNLTGPDGTAAGLVESIDCEAFFQTRSGRE